jgi:hypothetical protein
MDPDLESVVVDPIRSAQAPRRPDQTLPQASNLFDPLRERGLDGRNVHAVLSGHEEYRADIQGHRSDIRDELDHIAWADAIDTVMPGRPVNG